MARRPVFIPDPFGDAPVRTVFVEFSWHPGLAKTQKQKSITSLHNAAKAMLGIDHLLEVSSKSEVPLGVALSAFNLMFSFTKRTDPVCVECVFQSSKVFESGGPYRDILVKTARDAKRDPRLQTSGPLKNFNFMDEIWSLDPQTAFYDWLYISALAPKRDLIEQLSVYSAFTDIEFNPEKSINCQAYSLALFISLLKSSRLGPDTKDRNAFLKFLSERRVSNARHEDLIQGTLF